MKLNCVKTFYAELNSHKVCYGKQTLVPQGVQVEILERTGGKNPRALCKVSYNDQNLYAWVFVKELTEEVLDAK